MQFRRKSRLPDVSAITCSVSVVALLMISVASAETVEVSPEAERAFSKSTPADLDDLRAIENHVQQLAKAVLPSTVNVRVGAAQGSGVIVSRDGYVMTAAHVIGKPGRSVVFTFHDGKTARGTTLGVFKSVDAGLAKITTKGKWPMLEKADSSRVRVGDWCLATGHPGGYKSGRPPVVRLGRIVTRRDTVIQSDCALVGGDSGGPLLDMQGRVIGIHSRIGPSIAWNFHVPSNAFVDNWDRLAESEEWGRRPGSKGAIIGISGDDHPRGLEVTEVPEGYPAHRANIKPGDIIVELNDKSFEDFDEFADRIREKAPGDKVKIELLRSNTRLTKYVTLASRG